TAGRCFQALSQESLFDWIRWHWQPCVTPSLCPNRKLGRRLDCTKRKKRSALRVSHSGQAGNVEALVLTIAPPRARTCATRGVPQSSHSVLAGAGQEPPVPRERNAPDAAGVPLEADQVVSALRLPQPKRPVRTAAGDQPRVPAQPQGKDVAAVAKHFG